MHRFLLVITLLLGFTAPAAAQEPAKVTTLFSRDLSDIPGKEGTMLIVEYPPGAADPVHRHNANAFVYVLEGSVIMQVKGSEPVTLHPGQTFYEGPPAPQWLSCMSFVFKGEFEPGTISLNLAIADNQVLLDHFGYTQLA